MKAYLLTTGSLFGVLALLHGWRVVAESRSLGRDPWFLVITLLSAALCVWAVRLLRQPTTK
jgi:hypothetical protein